MIPKIIHYCWFGGKSKPQVLVDLLVEWKSVLPDYQFIEWNEKNFDIKRIRYSKEAWYLKKWAFVSDVARMYALYEFGGVYLDTDIIILKSFNKYLTHKSFIGYEIENKLGTGVIGAQKGEKWIKKMLDYYNTHDFILKSGKIDYKPNTDIVTELINELQKEDMPYIYPYEVFCACNWRNGEICKTEDTVAIHNYASSWTNDKTSFIEKVENCICFRLKLKNRHITKRITKMLIDRFH